MCWHWQPSELKAMTLDELELWALTAQAQAKAMAGK